MSVKTKSYETFAVFSTKEGDEAVKALVEKFTNLIAENGTIDSVDEWGKRRLAYEINRETEGYYLLVNFTSSHDFPAELDRIYKITEGVIRSLIVVKEEPSPVPATAQTPAPVVAQVPASVADPVPASVADPAPAPAADPAPAAPAQDEQPEDVPAEA